MKPSIVTTSAITFSFAILVFLCLSPSISLGETSALWQDDNNSVREIVGNKEVVTAVANVSSIMGRHEDMVVLQTADGGYRCVAQQDLSPELLFQITANATVSEIYRAYQVCIRLKDAPEDLDLLNIFGATAARIVNTNAFCHYVAIYYIGCLCEGDMQKAASALQAIRNKDAQSRYLKLFTIDALTMKCSWCTGTGRMPNGSSQSCTECEGKRWMIDKLKTKRVFRELLRDGEMNLAILQVELTRSNNKEPESFAGTKAIKNDNESLPPRNNIFSSYSAEPSETTPDQIRNNSGLWNTTVVVNGKVTQVVKQLDNYYMVILDGNWRCQLRMGLTVRQSELQHQQVQVQGFVVPRPDKLITTKPHMVNCVLF